MCHETHPEPLMTANPPSGALRQTFILSLACLLLILSGCAGSSQGVKYSGKNTKNYTPLPIVVPEERLLGMLETISGLLGTGYNYGGSSAAGFDCSGFVQYVYRSAFGAAVPRTSRDLSEWGKKISRNRLRRGDLVFFRTGGSGINHVGIYIDDDLFAHASSSRGVTIGNLDNGYYDRHYARAVRLLEIRKRAR